MVPLVPGFEERWPEREGAALPRAGLVYCAAVRFTAVKDTVTVFPLSDAWAPPLRCGIPVAKIFDGDTKGTGKGLLFPGGVVYGPRFTAAAPSASETGKGQTVLPPETVEPMRRIASPIFGGVEGAFVAAACHVFTVFVFSSFGCLQGCRRVPGPGVCPVQQGLSPFQVRRTPWGRPQYSSLSPSAG